MIDLKTLLLAKSVSGGGGSQESPIFVVRLSNMGKTLDTPFSDIKLASKNKIPIVALAEDPTFNITQLMNLSSKVGYDGYESEFYFSCLNFVSDTQIFAFSLMISSDGTCTWKRKNFSVS